MTIAYRDANGNIRQRAATGTGTLIDPDVAITAVTGALTDTELRAAPLDVTGALTDAELRAAPLGVTGPVTDAELRATPLPVRETSAPAARFTLFGQQRAVSPTIVFVTTPSYDVDPLRWEYRTSGAGNTATWNANKRQVDLTLASAGYVVAQSRRYIVYEPGRPVRITQTGPIGTHRDNVGVRWGQFDAANGLFWERTSTGVLRLGKRSSVSGIVVNEYYEQAVWNGPDALPVGFDEAFDQVWFVEYAWLGTAGARWGFYDRGQIHYVHSQDYNNTAFASYMQTATLPIRWEVFADVAPASPAVVGKVCAEVESEGGYFTQAAFPFASGRLTGAAISTATTAPLLALRPALTFGGITNRVLIDVRSVDVLAQAAPVDWRLLYYPPGTANPITGGSWAAPNVYSATEVNAAGTALSLTGAIEVARGSVAASGGGGGGIRGTAISNVSQAYPLVLDMAGANNPLTSAVGDNPAYLVLAAIGAGATASGGAEWWETR